jgi:hypothetical protein
VNPETILSHIRESNLKRQLLAFAVCAELVVYCFGSAKSVWSWHVNGTSEQVRSILLEQIDFICKQSYAPANYKSITGQ